MTAPEVKTTPEFDVDDMPFDWLDTPGGFAFVAMNGGREQAKAMQEVTAQAEAAALRAAIDDYEVTYDRRPAASELRYHPAVRQDLHTTFTGQARDFAAATRWVDPRRTVLVSDEQVDTTVTVLETDRAGRFVGH